MVSKKFQNKVDNMTNSELVALHEDLRHRVETGKLGFGKRALNLLKGVAWGILGGEATGFAASLIQRNPHLPGTPTLAHAAAPFNARARQSVGEYWRDSRGTAMTQAITTLGVAIPATYLENKKSKRNVREQYEYAAEVLRQRMESNGVGQDQGQSR